MIKLAFYKGGGTWFDKIVKWRTGGIHTHVEIVFPDDGGGEGNSFSSSQWDGGTRFKQIEYDPAKWDIIPIGEFDAKLVRDYCRVFLGVKYDWVTLLDIMAGKEINEDVKKLFCSEIAHYVAKGVCRIFKGFNSSTVTPEDLYKMAYSRAEALGYI